MTVYDLDSRWVAWLPSPEDLLNVVAAPGGPALYVARNDASTDRQQQCQPSRDGNDDLLRRQSTMVDRDR